MGLVGQVHQEEETEREAGDGMYYPNGLLELS